MPANEGGTHGSMSTYVVTDGRLRTPMNAEIQGNLTWTPPTAWVKNNLRGGVGIRTSKQPSNRLPAVACSSAELVEQFFGRPRRLTAHVPLRQCLQRLVVGESESSSEPAADAKRANVAMLAGYRRRHGSEVPLRPLDGWTIESRAEWTRRWLPGGRLFRPRKVFGAVAGLHIQIADCHKMRLGAFVVEVAR